MPVFTDAFGEALPRPSRLVVLVAAACLASELIQEQISSACRSAGGSAIIVL
jgi:hypothetical protein